MPKKLTAIVRNFVTVVRNVRINALKIFNSPRNIYLDEERRNSMEPDYYVRIRVWNYFLGQRTEDNGYFIGRDNRNGTYNVVHLF